LAAAWETVDNDVRQLSGTGSSLSEHNLLRRQLALPVTAHAHAAVMIILILINCDSVLEKSCLTNEVPHAIVTALQTVERLY